MTDRRWPMIAGVVVAMLVIAAVGWAAGRSSAPDGSAQASSGGDSAAAIRVVEGVPVGVEQSRVGALAATDNYVAMSSDSAVQSPKRYEQLVRQAYAPGYQGTALREAANARKAAPQSAELYRAGGKSLAVVAARRLDAYDDARATTTTWVAGITWGPSRVPGHTWSLVETSVTWDGDRWRVTKLDVARRPAPAPQRLGFSSDDQLRTSTFDRELRAMTAPIYGGD